jgi:CRP-like cAMP-binding protein
VAGIEPGQLFAESFSCAEADVLPISVTASEDSEIMLIDCRRILTLCTNTCEFHHQLVKNLLRVVAEKNLMLTQKIEFTSQKTTRDKLTAYLLFQAKKQRSSSFTIPYDRQALADYLGVERSAMSAELSKMRKEGLLECRKNSFTLLNNM